VATGCRETLQKVAPSRLAHNTKLPGGCGMDFDLVAFPKFRDLKDGGGDGGR
jgi:hypothetical protein